MILGQKYHTLSKKSPYGAKRVILSKKRPMAQNRPMGQKEYTLSRAESRSHESVTFYALKRSSDCKKCKNIQIGLKKSPYTTTNMCVLDLVQKGAQISEPLLECLQLFMKSMGFAWKVFLNRERGGKTEQLGWEVAPPGGDGSGGIVAVAVGHGHGHGAWVTSGGPWGSLWGALSTPRNRASGGSGRAVLAFLFTPIPAGGLLVKYRYR